MTAMKCGAAQVVLARNALTKQAGWEGMQQDGGKLVLVDTCEAGGGRNLHTHIFTGGHEKMSVLLSLSYTQKYGWKDIITH